MPSALHEGLIEVFRFRPSFAAELVAELFNVDVPAWQYLTTLHARLRCPAMLLVLSPNARCADWCAQAIRVGHPNWELRPLVLGPKQMPLVTDATEAAGNPELSLLSVMAHGDGPQRDKIVDSFSAGIADHRGRTCHPVS